MGRSDCNSYNLTYSSGDISVVDGKTQYTDTTVNPGSGYWHSPCAAPFPKLEKDVNTLFKQIVSLLGIKIINVAIHDDEVILCGRRDRKKYTITIRPSNVTVQDEKGKTISDIQISAYAYPMEKDRNIGWFSPGISTTDNIFIREGTLTAGNSGV